MSSGVVVGGKRLTTVPSFDTRNLVKFHLMSLSFSTLLLMVLNRAAEALAFKPLYSSAGAAETSSATARLCKRRCACEQHRCYHQNNLFHTNYWVFICFKTTSS